MVAKEIAAQWHQKDCCSVVGENPTTHWLQKGLVLSSCYKARYQVATKSVLITGGDNARLCTST